MKKGENVVLCGSFPRKNELLKSSLTLPLSCCRFCVMQARYGGSLPTSDVLQERKKHQELDVLSAVLAV